MTAVKRCTLLHLYHLVACSSLASSIYDLVSLSCLGASFQVSRILRLQARLHLFDSISCTSQHPVVRTNVVKPGAPDFLRQPVLVQTLTQRTRSSSALHPRKVKTPRSIHPVNDAKHSGPARTRPFMFFLFIIPQQTITTIARDTPSLHVPPSLRVLTLPGTNCSCGNYDE